MFEFEWPSRLSARRGDTNAAHSACTNLSIFIAFGTDFCVMTPTHCSFTSTVPRTRSCQHAERLILGVYCQHANDDTD